MDMNGLVDQPCFDFVDCGPADDHEGVIEYLKA